VTDPDPIETLVLNWAKTVKAVADALPTDPVAEAEMDRLMAKAAEGRATRPITRRGK
jgi:hypothetical protein